MNVLEVRAVRLAAHTICLWLLAFVPSEECCRCLLTKFGLA